MKRSGWTLVGLALLLLAMWLPRARALDHVVTPDERKWLARSANFAYALSTRDWAATFQREHPGVTIMWAGALGVTQAYPAYAEEAPGYFGWEREEIEQWLRANTTLPPLAMLNAGRRWIILIAAAATMVAYFGLARLTGRGLALLALLYVALDPFFIAHSFELHPDGLLASFSLAAIIMFLAWLYGDTGWRYLIISGLMLGLAGLTKTPAIFLVPAAVVFMLVASVRNTRPPRQLGWGLLTWGGVAIMTVFLLWPALWVAPVGTLRAMLQELQLYAEGHINPNFFMGAPTQEPGLLFYPLALLLRMTPATLLGLLGAAVLAPLRKWPFSHKPTLQACGGLLLFAVLFLLGINLGAKRFDRYLLPAALCLEVIAALGLAGLVHTVATFAGARATTEETTLPRVTLAGAALLMLAGHGFFALQHQPYFLTYYNPLLGGAPAAERLIMIGWGEGLDGAAAWLDQQPDAATSDVVAWYGDGPLSYFWASERPPLDFWQPDFWLDADYAVIYVNQRQRAIPAPETLEIIEAGELLEVVKRHGVDWARIYRVSGVPPASTGLRTESATNFGTRLELAAYTLGEPIVLAGDPFLLRLHLRKLDATSTRYRQVVSLLGPAGEVVWQDEAELDAANHSWPPWTYVHSYVEIRPPGDLPKGSYTVTVTYCDLAAREACLAPQAYRVTAVEVRQSVTLTEQFEWPEAILSDVRHDRVLVPGAEFFVNAAAEPRTDVPLKLSFRLVDATQQTVAQADVPLGRSMEIKLDVPPDLAQGNYTLTAVLYDPETLAALGDSAGRFATPLTEVRVEE